MVKTSLVILLSLGLIWSAKAQNLNELTATDAVTGKTMNLGSMTSGKALVMIFHSLNCPFAKLYESRIKALKTTFQNQGVGFLLINPEVGISESEQTVLREYIDQSGMNMSYLIDAGQAWTKVFGITKIPEVIVLTPGPNGLQITYRGAIDNNPQSESAVSERHLERALNHIMRGESPSPPQVRAVGCNIRTY
ncbi:redoxin domain-containing protein [Algoriphagus sp.]|uniref:redoxin domain-containing protein n=1 Tax=Algoriphagus sp. TaxID=1872435 RepID=UPI00391B6741